jgi:hypothetical protein
LAQNKLKPHRSWPRRVLYVVAAVIVVLIAVRLALPYELKNYVNRKLNESQDYGGSIGHVTVHLWRGAYQIHDINIVKKAGNVPTPFFSAALLDLSLQWSELIHGKLVSKIIMVGPHVNFVSGPTKQQSQAGTENNWNDTLQSLVPFKINSLVITNGQIHFKNPYSTPPVDIYMTDLFSVATNLTNSREVKQALPAGIHASAQTLGHGQMTLQCNLNPLNKAPTFQVSVSLTNVDLTQLNTFLEAYGKFDVAKGDFAMFTSFAAADGKYDGYVKIFFKDLDVFQWQKEKKKDILKIFWDAVVGTVADVLKNHPHDQLATKVPVSGAFNNSDIHLWPTIETLLRNAFVRALVPKFDERVDVEAAKSVQPDGSTSQPVPKQPVLKTDPAKEKSGTIQMLGTNQPSHVATNQPAK